MTTPNVMVKKNYAHSWCI